MQVAMVLLQLKVCQLREQTKAPYRSTKFLAINKVCCIASCFPNLDAPFNPTLSRVTRKLLPFLPFSSHRPMPVLSSRSLTGWHDASWDHQVATTPIQAKSWWPQATRPSPVPLCGSLSCVVLLLLCCRVQHLFRKSIAESGRCKLPYRLVQAMQPIQRSMCISKRSICFFPLNLA